MRFSKVLIAGCVALLLAGTVAAEIGNYSFSYSVTPIGSDRIDFTLTSSTTGATTYTSYEGLSNTVYLSGSTIFTWDYDYGYRSAISPNYPTGPYGMLLASNFSFTGLPPGSYFYFVSGAAWYWGYSTYYSTYTWIYPDSSYATGAAFLGVAVPTAGQYGLILLGLALAASGVILLRRI